MLSQFDWVNCLILRLFHLIEPYFCRLLAFHGNDRVPRPGRFVVRFSSWTPCIRCLHSLLLDELYVRLFDTSCRTTEPPAHQSLSLLTRTENVTRHFSCPLPFLASGEHSTMRYFRLSPLSAIPDALVLDFDACY